MATNCRSENVEKIKVYFIKVEETYKGIKHGRIKPTFSELLSNFCQIIGNNEIAMDFKHFKFIASKETYSFLIEHINLIIQTILTSCEHTILHINLKSLSISDIDKHQLFIKNLSESKNFVENISYCNVYNSGFVFSSLLTSIFMFLNIETRKEIKNKLHIIS